MLNDLSVNVEIPKGEGLHKSRSETGPGCELLRLQQTLYESKNPTRRWLHCTRRDWIVAAIRRYLPAGEKKALEIGPGSGVYLAMLASLFDRVTATDIEDAYLDHAQRLADAYPNLALLTDDITHSQLADASFDMILCSEVIEHVPDPESALKEMHRLLKPGGILILSTPQRHSTLELVAKVAFLPGVVNLVKLIYREAILEMGHINLMTERQVRLRLRTSGFEVIEYFKSGLYLPFIAEFAGKTGLRLESWLESKFRPWPVLSRLLWTQYFVARA
jgi:ubiquinone/menaquinone biosynthesis C-methylase UbiE